MRQGNNICITERLRALRSIDRPKNRRARRRLLRVAVLSLVLLPPLTGSAKTFVDLKPFDRAVYDSLDKPTFDNAAHFEVIPESVWHTDLGDYRFKSGTLTFLTTVGGRPTGCFFVGEGSLTFAPPSAIEQGQLFRYCGDSILTSEFDNVYIRFFDPQIAQELHALTEQQSTDRPPRKKILRRVEKYATDDLTIRFAAQGWQSLAINGPGPRFLYIQPHLKGHRRLHFIADETAVESVTLWRRPPGDHTKGTIDLVCSYDATPGPDSLMQRAAFLHGGFDIASYDTDVRISGSAEMSCQVSLATTVRQPVLVDWTFSLAPDLTVDSVWIGGDPCQFIYDDRGGWLVARPPRHHVQGDTVTVRFHYSSKTLLDKDLWGDFAINHTTRWLPTAAPRQRTDYETTFHFPKQYDIVSVGERISDTTIGDIRTTCWHTFDPVSYISFNYGVFERFDLPMKDGPRLEIYRSKHHRRGLFSGDIRKAVAADIEGALSLFARSFGPYPWGHLAATEIPGFHGQGFPQLLHLAWDSFDSNRKGITDAFRAHEVAHQWFGHIVGWKTYHDQWLSEGFAEYAGAMYVQERYEGDKEFLNELKEWRASILESGGRFAWHEGPKAAPIWLGFRCASRQAPGSYLNLVYSKGAYVLHMLRQMLYDFDTGSDQRFRAMMTGFVSQYAGTDASTIDFQRVVEEHLGMPMQWFFDQWVYGVAVPRYEYRWTREETPDGRWIVHGQIDQFDVDSTFRAYMPITTVSQNGRSTVMQHVTTQTTHFVSPPLDDKPTNIVFNDFRTVLCREKIVAKP